MQDDKKRPADEGNNMTRELFVSAGDTVSLEEEMMDMEEEADEENDSSDRKDD